MAKQLLTAQSLDGHTAMHIAARFGRRGCVKSLARRLPDLVKVKNHSGHPSLHEAARRGNDSCVETLLALGGAVELSATSKKYAQSRGHSEIADALVQMEKRLKAQKSMKYSRSAPSTLPHMR
ncbi:Ankk1 [Symbiodinium necroappetens]|nr:Ankk1 [Symbiodinium necroappetens]